MDQVHEEWERGESGGEEPSCFLASLRERLRIINRLLTARGKLQNAQNKQKEQVDKDMSE